MRIRDVLQKSPEIKRCQIAKAGMDPDNTSCTCDDHAVRKQTIGGDTLF